jgi:hypothetical protein
VFTVTKLKEMTLWQGTLLVYIVLRYNKTQVIRENYPNFKFKKRTFVTGAAAAIQYTD